MSPLTGPDASLWRVIEVAADQWWAVGAAGVAYALAPGVAERLWADGARGAESLGAAIEAATRDRSPAVAGEYSHRAAGQVGEGNEKRTAAFDAETGDAGTGCDVSFIDLSFAGVTARYLCESPAMAARLAWEYPACRPALRSTPDIIIRLTSGCDVDRLHRANGGMGLFLRKPGQVTWTPALGELPVIPPIEGTRLGQEFAALHAALLLTAAGPLVIAGRQKAGKTTAALIGSELGLGTVATDELVLLGRGATVYGVPLMLRIRGDGGRTATPIPPSPSLCEQGARARAIVLLERVEAREPWASIPDAGAALSKLSEHLRPLALGLGDCVVAALELLQHAVVWRAPVRSWPALADDVASGLIQVAEEAAR
jgi:hypothetical protein